LLSDGDYDRLGNALKTYPPVRTASDRAALNEGLRTGAICSMGTDHAPHADEEKFSVPLGDAAPGNPGVETLYLAALDLALRHGDPWDAVRWVSETPARNLGLHPAKGAMRVGSDADLVLVDPAGETIAGAIAHSRQGRSPLDGRHFPFAIQAVWSRGELVARDGRAVGAAGRGRFVRPQAAALGGPRR
jgi:dihydroorotase-like cyclic amidohydrolase